MDYLDIKFGLAKKGYTLKRLGLELGLSGSQAIGPVIARKYISARVEKRIAEILELPLETVFPDRYPVDTRKKLHRGAA